MSPGTPRLVAARKAFLVSPELVAAVQPGCLAPTDIAATTADKPGKHFLAAEGIEALIRSFKPQLAYPTAQSLR
jgi:hypothetical protein